MISRPVPILRASLAGGVLLVLLLVFVVVLFLSPRTDAESPDVIRYRAEIEERTRTLGPEHPDSLQSRSSFAFALAAQGFHGEALAEQRAVLAIRERVLGAEHLSTLVSRYNLAYSLYDSERKEEALRDIEAAYPGMRKALGDSHPWTADAKRLVEIWTKETRDE